MYILNSHAFLSHCIWVRVWEGERNNSKTLVQAWTDRTFMNWGSLVKPHQGEPSVCVWRWGRWLCESNVSNTTKCFMQTSSGLKNEHFHSNASSFKAWAEVIHSPENDKRHSWKIAWVKFINIDVLHLFLEELPICDHGMPFQYMVSSATCIFHIEVFLVEVVHLFG